MAPYHIYLLPFPRLARPPSELRAPTIPGTLPLAIRPDLNQLNKYSTQLNSRCLYIIIVRSTAEAAKLEIGITKPRTSILAQLCSVGQDKPTSRVKSRKRMRLNPGQLEDCPANFSLKVVSWIPHTCSSLWPPVRVSCIKNMHFTIPDRRRCHALAALGLLFLSFPWRVARPPKETSVQ